MPAAFKRPCSKPGCKALTFDRYCDAHRQHAEQTKAERRGNATARGYGWRWRKARSFYLAEHPLCAACLRRGITHAATDVDHIVPHKGDDELMWNDTNWQSMCEECHGLKSYAESIDRDPRELYPDRCLVPGAA